MRRFTRLALLAFLCFALFLSIARVTSAQEEDVALDEVATEEEIDQLYADVEDDESNHPDMPQRKAPANPKETGYLIVQKKLDTTGFAVGNNVTVSIKLFNVGGGPAYDIYVKDSWPLEHFDLIDGELTANFETIEAGEFAELNFTVVPKTVGGMKGFPAIGFYKPTPNADPLTVVSSFYVDQIPIFSASRFKKLSKTHDFEKIIYYLGMTAVFFGPLVAQFHYANNFLYGVPTSVVKSKSS